MMANLAIEHIISVPGVHDGKPFIARKSITVQYIAGLYNHEWTANHIAEEHELTLGEVHVALSYYFDHKAGIDESIRTSDELVKRVGTPARDLIRKLEARKRSR